MKAFTPFRQSRGGRIGRAAVLALLLSGLPVATVLALTPVSPDDAQRAAAAWVGEWVRHEGAWAGTARPRVGAPEPLYAADGALAGYVCAVRPSGFVVVPAVRELPPVKSFSTRGSLPAGTLPRRTLADVLAASTQSLKSAENRRDSTMDASANLAAWDAFLKPLRDAYSGIPGVTFVRRDPLLDNLDRWDFRRQSAGDHDRYSGSITWHPWFPLNSALPKVRTVPEELWVDRDDNGTFKEGDDADLVVYDADGGVATPEGRAGTQTGVYFWDWDGIGTYRRYTTDADAAALDPVHLTLIWGQGYDVWKDEEGGVPGRYDEAFDTRIFDGGDGWQTPDGSPGAQGEQTTDPAQPKGRLFYSDLDSSQDYTNWFGRPLLGGAAVSFGEIMRYWEWPDVGRGSHSYQWAYHEAGADPEQNITLSADFEHPYIWSNMPLWGLFTGTATTSEIKETARLLADIGIAFETDFQLSSPVVSFDEANLQRFAYHFRYNQHAIRRIKRAEYQSDEEWFEQIRAEIDAHRPVVLIPYKDANTMHPLVADGYDRIAGSANVYLLHCNMGWGGIADYWYALDNIGGAPGGVYGEELNLVQLQEAVVNILPQRVRRTVVAEVFRASGSARAADVQAALQGLVNDYGADGLVVLAWHPGDADPLRPGDEAGPALMQERLTAYGLDGDQIGGGDLCATVFDGLPAEVYATAAGDADDPAVSLRAELERRLTDRAAFRVVGESVLAEAGPESPEGLPYVTADVYVSGLDDNTETWDDLRLRVFLIESDVDAGGSPWSWVVRRVLLQQDFSLGSGQTKVFRIGPVHPGEVADMTHAAVVAVLERASTGAVLQGALLDRYDYGFPWLENHPPAQPVRVTVSRRWNGGVLEALEAHPIDAFDPDGDRLTYLVRWFRNGVMVPLAGEENHLVLTADEAGGAFTAGDIWFCDVRVRDAWYYAVDARLTNDLMFTLKQTNPYVGSPLAELRDTHETEPVSSDSVVIIGDAPPSNAPPSAPPSVVLSDTSPPATSDVRCLVGGSEDPDGDDFAYVFAWQRFDAAAGDFVDVPGLTDAVLPASVTTEGERWRCAVRARDVWGAESDTTVSDELTIGSPDPSAPSAPTHAAVSPGAPSYVGTLHCSTPVGITAPEPYEVVYNWWRRVGLRWELTDVNGPDVPSDRLHVGDAWRCEVYARTTISGVCGPSYLTEEVVVRNFAPSEPQVSVYPSVASPDAEIVCNADGSIDPEDADNITYHYQWYVNGRPAGVATATVPAGATAAGERWYCRVYAEDTLGVRSATVQTSEVIVGTRPTPPTRVLVQPAEPDAETDLTCVAGGSVDADGDVVRYLFQWYRNGEIQSGLNEAGLPAAVTSYGEYWKCEVRATDGLLTSAPVMSNEVRIGGNQPPGAPVIAIEPETPSPGEVLRCVIVTDAVDPDGQEVAYIFEWQKNGAPTNYTTAELPAGVTVEGDVWQCYVYAVDPEGARSETVASPEISFVNQSPSAPASVSVSPASPKADADLVCTASGAVDPNGDAVTYHYEWFVYQDPDKPGAAASSGVTESTLPAALTADGQYWFCRVFATDSKGAAGPTADSNSVFIGDVPPNPADVVTVTPDPAGVVEDLICSPCGGVDPNGDAVTYLFQWLRNGAPEPGQQNYRLSRSLLTIGDRWACEVRTTDGVNVSDPVVSNEVVIIDLAPVPPDSVQITPATPTDLDDLVCSAFGASDPEGEPVHFEYQWIRNGEATTYTGNVLPADATAVGEQWTCRVVAVDPAGNESDPVLPSGTVTIVAAAPSPPTVVVTPLAPTVSDALSCTASDSEDPYGDDVTYFFRWYRDGVDAGITDSVVPASETREGEVWTCVVFARSTHGVDSPAVTSNEVLIGNHPPSAPTLVLQPSAPRAGLAILCIASGSVDPDGHAVAYQYVWYRNGAPTGYTDAELPEGVTVDGESWECHVTPADAYGAEGPETVSPAVVVGNQPPTDPNPTLSPDVPVIGGTITCSVTGVADPNGDAVVIAYRWQFDDGAGWQDSGDDGATVGPLVQDGRRWRCLVTATDGVLDSATVAGNVVVVTGHAPSAPTNVTIAPENPGAGDELVCTASGSTDPDGDPVAYLFQWYRNGVPTGIAGDISPDGTSSTLPADVTGDGETWYCTVTPQDARGAVGPSVESDRVTVRHAPPPAPVNVRIVPGVPTQNNDLKCLLDGPQVDALGEPVAFVFTWYRDGVEQSDLTGTVVPASETAAGQKWACEVRTRSLAGALSDPVRSADVVIAAAGNDAFESDNQREAASELEPGGFQAHGMDAADAGDWIRFRIFETSEVHLDVYLLTGSTELQVDVYRADERDPFLTRQGDDIRVAGIWSAGTYELLVRDAAAVRDVTYYGVRLAASPAVSLGTDAAPAEFTLTETAPERWFQVILTSQAAFSVRRTVLAGSADIYMGIFTADGAPVGTETTESVIGTGASLAAGVYHVRLRGENFVTARDGRGLNDVHGVLTLESTTAIPGNRPPAAPAFVRILPEQPQENERLVAVANGAVDPDWEDAVNAGEEPDPNQQVSTLVYRWFRNGREDPQYTGPEIPPAAVMSGDQWQCRVTAVDGYGAASEAVLSNTVTVGALPDWSVAIEAAGAGASGLVIGQNGDASNDWDAGYDDVAPPPAPEDSPRAWLLGPSGHEELLRDVRSTRGSVVHWHMRLHDRDRISLTWDLSGLHAGAALTIAEVDPATWQVVPGTELDMRSASGLDPSSAANPDPIYRVTYTAPVLHYETVHLEHGWNLVSFWLSGESDAVADVFQGVAHGTVWMWDAENNVYRAAETVTPGAGYWVFAPAPADLIHIGYAAVDGRVQIAPGWNLVGPLGDVPPPGPPTVLSVWGYAAASGYFQPEVLELGRGYWMYATQAATLNLR